MLKKNSSDVLNESKKSGLKIVDSKEKIRATSANIKMVQQRKSLNELLDMIHEEKLPEGILPEHLNKVTPDNQVISPNNRNSSPKNFIQQNIENLKFLK